METKLIIVTGMSGAGKSTTSKALAKLIEKNGHPSIWYHEEMAEHPIRWAQGGEFQVGDLRTKEGMEKNLQDLFSRWETFLVEIQKKGGYHVMEGCLYQNINRYFFEANMKKEEIFAFYDQLMALLSIVDVHVVFLCPRDVRKTLMQAFETRGERWKNIILDEKDSGYFQDKPYVGVESIFAMYEDYKEVSKEVFKRFHGKKIKISVEGTKQEWEEHLNTLAAFLGMMPVVEEPYVPEQVFRHCGVLYNAAGERTSLEISCIEEELYLSTSWFQYMQMEPIRKDYFELMSFPIQLRFSFEEEKKFVTISGNYGWQLNGQTYEIKSE